ncbi:tyrosine-type recombinase/integrase [Lactobacillus sp. AN1001]
MAKITEYTNSKGKFYRFRVYVGIDEQTGKKKYVKRAGFKTKADAKKALVKLEYEIDTGNYFKPASVQTFRDVYSLWLEQYKLTVKPSSLRTICNDFTSQILPVLGSYKVDKLTLGICQSAVNQWYKARPSTFSRLVVYASLVVDYAIKLKITNKNPFRDVTKPRRKKRRTNNNFLNADKLKQFLAIAEKRSLKHFALFRLLAYSGMRIGEMLALDWSDIDFDSNVIAINKTIAKDINGSVIIQPPKTPSSVRRLDMDKSTMDILKRWKAQQASELLKVGINVLNKKQAVFNNAKNNTRLTNDKAIYMLHVLLKGSGLPWVTLHGFRHTHATLLFSAGASVKEVQTRLGHSSVTTTLDIYTHLTKQDQKKTINKFAQFME